MQPAFTCFLSACLFAIAPLGSSAQTTGFESTSTRIETANDARGLEGVGRLDINGADGASGFCTAALISPTQILTAAHCLFNKTTGQPFSNEAMTFRAGLRLGGVEATRRVRRMVIHPDYIFSEDPDHLAIRSDLALLELDHDMRLPRVRPFDAAGQLRNGDPVELVSYARGRSEAALREEGCRVLDRDDRILVLSCSVDFGASGAPVFVRTATGLQIVSVISAMSYWNDRPIALAVTVESGLEFLKREFNRAPQLSTRHKRLRIGEDGGNQTIRFHRPER